MRIGYTPANNADGRWRRFFHLDSEYGEEEFDLKVRPMASDKFDSVRQRHSKRKKGGEEVIKDQRAFSSELFDFILADWGREGIKDENGRDRDKGPVGQFDGEGKLRNNDLALKAGIQCAPVDGGPWTWKTLPCTRGYKKFFLDYLNNRTSIGESQVWLDVLEFARSLAAGSVDEEDQEVLEEN